MTDKILFVCSGNTCRSVMAKGIYKKRCQEENINIDVNSAGINVIYSSPASDFAISTMKKFNIDVSNHVSKQITKEDIISSKIILTMEKYHRDIIKENIKEAKNKVYTLYEYVKNIDKDIKDPYGQREEEYIKTAEELRDLIYNIKII